MTTTEELQVSSSSGPPSQTHFSNPISSRLSPSNLSSSTSNGAAITANLSSKVSKASNTTPNSDATSKTLPSPVSSLGSSGNQFVYPPLDQSVINDNAILGQQNNQNQHQISQVNVQQPQGQTFSSKSNSSPANQRQLNGASAPQFYSLPQGPNGQYNQGYLPLPSSMNVPQSLQQAYIIPFFPNMYMKYGMNQNQQSQQSQTQIQSPGQKQQPLISRQPSNQKNTVNSNHSRNSQASIAKQQNISNLNFSGTYSNSFSGGIDNNKSSQLKSEDDNNCKQASHDTSINIQNKSQRGATTMEPFLGLQNFQASQYYKQTQQTQQTQETQQTEQQQQHHHHHHVQHHAQQEAQQHLHQSLASQQIPPQFQQPSLTMDANNFPYLLDPSVNPMLQQQLQFQLEQYQLQQKQTQSPPYRSIPNSRSNSNNILQNGMKLPNSDSSLIISNTSSDESKPYKCSECSWSFARQSDLRRHMRSHSAPEYHCPFWHPEYATCPHRNQGSFNRLDVLKRHLRLVHFDPETKLINEDSATLIRRQDNGTCLSCAKYFINLKSFIDHVGDCALNTPMEKWKYKKNGMITNVKKDDLADNTVSGSTHKDGFVAHNESVKQDFVSKPDFQKFKNLRLDNNAADESKKVNNNNNISGSVIADMYMHQEKGDNDKKSKSKSKFKPNLKAKSNANTDKILNTGTATETKTELNIDANKDSNRDTNKDAATSTRTKNKRTPIEAELNAISKHQNSIPTLKRPRGRPRKHLPPVTN